MTHEELREKVARAMFYDGVANREVATLSDVWAGLSAGSRAVWLSQADAALAAVREALREPSAAMIEEGWIDKEDVDPGDIWQAMLAASPLSDPRA